MGRTTLEEERVGPAHVQVTAPGSAAPARTSRAGQRRSSGWMIPDSMAAAMSGWIGFPVANRELRKE